MAGDATGRNTSKRWIILSYFANIDGKASSQHIDDRLAHLASGGIEPLLVSSVCSPARGDFPHFTVPCVAPSGIRFELRYLRRRSRLLNTALLPLYLLVLPFYFIEKLLINIDSQWSWFPMAFLRAVRLTRLHRPELVYSTGGPASAHLAAALLSRFTGLPWIAEMQDPLVHEAFDRGRAATALTARIERMILARASAVVYLTEAAARKALARTGADPSKVRVIPPGAAPPLLPPWSWSRGECCRFAHFGSLGGPRNLGTFLDALETVFTSDPAMAAAARLDLYGTMDEVSRKQIADFNHRGVVTDFGKVPRREAHLAMQKADILLLIQQKDALSFYTIPSKLYEYYQVNRPVLGLVYRNPGLRDLLARYGHFASEADSVEETAKSITEILAKWQDGDLDRSGPADLPFTVESATRKLIALSEKIASSGGRSA